METLTSDGRMEDRSGNGNHGTMTGTADVSGKIGRARQFNPGDRITTVPIQVPEANFTVAAWFNWTTNPTPYYSGIQGGGGSWELRVMADGRFGATFYQSIGPDIFTDIVSPLAYNDGEWHHAAAVLRNDIVELYVDGTLKAADTTSPILSVRPSTGVQIGHVASDFAGDIDEIRVFSRALTAAELAALANGSAVAVQFSHADHLAGVPSLVEGCHWSPYEGMERPVMLTTRLLGIDPASLIPRILPLVLGITRFAVVTVTPARARNARSRWCRRWKTRRSDVSQTQESRKPS